MLDLKWIRAHPDLLDKSLRRRGIAPEAARILALDEERRSIQTRLQVLQADKNNHAKAFGVAQAKGGADIQALKDKGIHIKEEIEKLAGQDHALATTLDDILIHLPNILADAVPPGADESYNVEIKRHLEPRPFAFTPKQHFELGEALGLMDFTQAAHMSGSRFVILKGELARLERAITQFMLDTHTQKFGYTEVSPPLLVKSDALFGVGQLPKFSADMFKTTNDYWLIPTGEVPLTNMGADQIFKEDDLPQRYVAYTPCFRSEAGAAGKDMRGMIRQHQFYKVELVSLVVPNASDAEHLRMLGAAEYILEALDIPYRVMALCEGDIGFHSQRTFDIEAWLPGQNAYREISSCSNCGDFQARRMKARFRSNNNPKDIQPIHTLNGSGLAVGRTLIAILENYQQADGSIVIPDVLRPYMGGLTKI